MNEIIKTKVGGKPLVLPEGVECVKCKSKHVRLYSLKTKQREKNYHVVSTEEETGPKERCMGYFWSFKRKLQSNPYPTLEIVRVVEDCVDCGHKEEFIEMWDHTYISR